MATIKEVAEKSGLSTATVSRVINNSGYASKSSRTKILNTCKKLGYPIDKSVLQDEQYKRNNSSIIGVVVPDITIPFYASVAKAIEDLAFEKNILAATFSSNENSVRELNILTLLKEMRIGCLAISPVINRLKYNYDFINTIKKSGIPVILFDRTSEGYNFDTVSFDDYLGAKMAANALIEAGHTKIAIMLGSPVVQNYIDRYNGYIDALSENGLPINNGFVLYGGMSGNDLSVASYDSTIHLLHSHPEVSSIICTNNMMAVGCIRAINALGLKLGKDISLISFDYSYLDTLYPGEISTILRPINKLSQSIFDILWERMNSSLIKGRKPSAKKIILQPTLMKRNSIYCSKL